MANIIIDTIRRVFGKHDSNGLKFTPEFLNRIEKEIVYYPIARQAKYADQVCVDNVNNDIFLFQQFTDFNLNDERNYYHVNATAVGNAAFIALNSNNLMVADLCKRWLENLKNVRTK